jgi:hypothetical protein
MLEWMIAITAVCGAISGLAILYLTLGAALRMRADHLALPVRRLGRLRLVRGRAELPRARIHRYARTHEVARRGEPGAERGVDRVRVARARRR